MIPTRNFQFNLPHFRQQFRGSNLSGSDLAGAIGYYFLGAPYQAGTLEAGGKEKLIVNFAQFDCFTFVETVLALTACAVARKISNSEFRRALQLIRYRQGIIDGYSSRLHYFADWLGDNEKKGIFADISRRLGGEPGRKKINYMTAHRTSYPGLKSEDEFQKMLLIEKKISRKFLNTIGKDRSDAQQAKIQNGDIIAFASDRNGLDVAHVGFAVRRGRSLRLLHASSKEGAVVISQKTLFAYLKQKKNISGIIVARLL